MKKTKNGIDIFKEEIEEIKREIHVGNVRMAINPKSNYND